MVLTPIDIFGTEQRIPIWQREPSKNGSCRLLLYLAARTTTGCRPKADLHRADLKPLMKLRPYQASKGKRTQESRLSTRG
jgi:hypothetical protein